MSDVKHRVRFRFDTRGKWVTINHRGIHGNLRLIERLMDETDLQSLELQIFREDDA